MNLTEALIIAIITTIGSIIGGGIMVLVSWRKAPSEIDRNQSESGKADAEASETWARSNQMAAAEIITLRGEVRDLRTRVYKLEQQVRTLGAVPVE